MLEQESGMSAVLEDEVTEADVSAIKERARQIEKANAFYRKLYDKWSNVIYSKTVLVKPQDVDELLKGENYRKCSEATIDHYVEEIISGRWRLATAIYFSKKKLLNGQHRLWAVKKSGVAVPFTFVYDLPENAATAFDNGKNRTGPQTIAYQVREGELDKDLYQDFPGAAGIAKAIEAGNVYKHRNYVSNTALPEMLERNKEELAFVKEIIFTPRRDEDGNEIPEKSKGIRRATFCAVVARAYRLYKNDKHKVSKLKKAVLRIRAGFFDETAPQDRMFAALRDRLLELDGGGSEICEEIYVKTSKVLDAVLNGEVLETLRFSKKKFVDPFPINEVK